MPRFAANLSMLFTEQAFLARFKAAADAGFAGVDTCSPTNSALPKSRRSWMPMA